MVRNLKKYERKFEREDKLLARKKSRAAMAGKVRTRSCTTSSQHEAFICTTASRFEDIVATLGLYAVYFSLTVFDDVATSRLYAVYSCHPAASSVCPRCG